MFAECEYVHPMTARSGNCMSPGRDHWRNNIPSTYYCTHAFGPIMYFVLKNALSYAFFKGMQDKMFWPFNSGRALTMETFKLGASINF